MPRAKSFRGEKPYKATVAYNQSKLANLLFSNELARRLHMLEGLGILVGGSERVDQLRPIERRPGALQRFLEERDD